MMRTPHLRYIWFAGTIIANGVGVLFERSGLIKLRTKVEKGSAYWEGNTLKTPSLPTCPLSRDTTLKGAEARWLAPGVAGSME
jgi:hypothetical protein